MSCERCKDWSQMGLSETCPSCDLARETSPNPPSNFESERDKMSKSWFCQGDRYPHVSFEAGANWARTFTLAECSVERDMLYDLLTGDKSTIVDQLKTKEEEIARLKAERDELKSARDKAAKLTCADCGAALARF